jgi:1,4-alpha-glucan branching enzyme
MTHPGKKLLFMGGEFGQFDEWKDFAGLDWNVLQFPLHDSMRRYVSTLNHVYLDNRELWERDHEQGGFEWIDVNNASQCMLSFQRNGKSTESSIVSVCNFSRETHQVYRIGVSNSGYYRLLLNSDDADYGGTGYTFPARVSAHEIPLHGKPYSIEVPVPGLSFQLWKSETA